jgi:hypothetical protein
MIKNMNKKYTFWGLILALGFILKYVLFFTIFIPLSVRYGPTVKEWCINVFVPSRVVKESGQIITENRNFKNFEKIKILGNGNLILGQNKSDGIAIEGDSNVVAQIETEIDGKTLIIRPKKGLFINSEKMIYHVNTQTVKEIELDGNIKCEFSNISKNAIKMYVHNNKNA